MVENVQQGAGQIGDAARPLGLSDREVQDAIRKARDQLEGGQVAGKLLTGAMLLVQWAAAVILIVVLTFFFIKDGTQLRELDGLPVRRAPARDAARDQRARLERARRPTCRASSWSPRSTRC